MSLFTPVSGLLGGSMIGLSAVTLLLGNGDILGASGICASFVLAPRKTLTESSQQWKVAFLASFLVTVRLYMKYIDPQALEDPRLGTDPALPIVSPLGFIVSGFLVGFGTRLGNGCTTGHGICGLARLSKRSFVGVCSFMLTGILSASACSPTCPLSPYLRGNMADVQSMYPTKTTSLIGTIITAIAVGAAIPAFLRPVRREGVAEISTENKEETVKRDGLSNSMRKLGPASLSASIFAVGLSISQMVKSFKIYGFLDFKGFSRGTWDPTLALVMGGGFLVSWIGYQFVAGHSTMKNSKALTCPLMMKKSVGKFNVPTNKIIDANLVFGEALFGLGWGIGGLCPGPALFLAGAGFPHLLFRWWPSFFFGSWLAQKIKDRQA